MNYLTYLKALIDRDNPASMRNALALIACLTLSIGFIGNVFRYNKISEISIITAGLVSIALFKKDREG